MYPNEGPENSSKKSQESEREAAVADLLLALVARCWKWVLKCGIKVVPKLVSKLTEFRFREVRYDPFLEMVYKCKSFSIYISFLFFLNKIIKEMESNDQLEYWIFFWTAMVHFENWFNSVCLPLWEPHLPRTSKMASHDLTFSPQVDVRSKTY